VHEVLITGLGIVDSLSIKL